MALDLVKLNSTFSSWDKNGTKSVLLSFDISLYRGLCNVKIIGSDTSR